MEGRREDQTIKLPTLLEGEVFVIWLELTTEQQKDNKITKKEILVLMILYCYIEESCKPSKAISVSKVTSRHGIPYCSNSLLLAFQNQ